LIGRAQEETMMTTGQLASAGSLALDQGAAAAPPPIRRGPAADRDASLVERLRRHEEGAAEALVAQYGDRTYRLAMRITNNSSDAEEVVQDALWAASRKIDTFRGTAAFGSWVYRITANAAYQKRRARRYDRNETPWEDLASTLDETGRPVQSATDWSPLLHDPALQAELQAALRSAIDELPDEHRATFLLHDVEGLSSPEIAEALQIKTATVKSRVHRARLFLRGRLTIYMDGATEPVASSRSSQ
jgi:RNA polymerase sigma-70 factor (ECF subfamily)